MTHCIYRLLPAVALGALGPLAWGQARLPGWTYTINTTVDSGDAAHRSSMATRYYVADGKFRHEFVQVSNMPAVDQAEGMYQIMNSADSTVTMVMPKQRMATIMNVGGLPGGRSLLPKIQSHVTKSQIDDLGPGEKILGHATRHVRATSEGTIDVSMMGQNCTGVLKSVSEMWIAPDVDLRAAMGEMVKTVNTTLGIPGAADAPGSATGTMPAGTPLRTISRSTGADPQGNLTTVTTTTDYVSLSQGPLDPALFAAPADFKVMDMRQMMAKMPAGMLDSAMSAGAASAASARAKAVCRAVGAP